MKFTTKEDIEAPIESVFAMVSDFENYERAALRRGAEVERKDRLTAPGVGMSWDVKFLLRGKERDMDITLQDYDSPNEMRFVSGSQGLAGEMEIKLVALSRNRTRMALDITLKPKNLSARLLVQSLKLARNNLNKRFHLRVADFAKDLEDRHQRG